jgi:hypothetical protein
LQKFNCQRAVGAILITRLHKFIAAPTAKTFNSRMMFWFSLSLTFATIYSLLGLQIAFSSEYVVQDDARQHLFWMRRFLDPSLFPNDLIADYFQSVAPLGYTTFYRLFAAVGIDPILLSKFLPIVLGLITTAYCFGVCLQMFPVPMAGFIASLLLNQNIWMGDDLVSATPRAFVYPLFVAFLYYLLRRSLIHCLVAIALLGVFYPPLLFIEVGILILGLLHWEGWLPHLSKNRLDYLFGATGLGVALLVMLPYAMNSSEFGPVVTGIEARALPEFNRSGRIPFFDDDFWDFWLYGRDSGIMKQGFQPLLSWAGLLLPILLRYPDRFPLVKQIARIKLLPQIALASIGMFLAAHLLLYKVFAPSRYTRYSLRLVMILAAGMAIAVILDAAWRWARQPAKRKSQRLFLGLGLTALLGAALVLYPSFLEFPKTNYIVRREPALYEFFQKQPKNILIASLSREADNLPPFSQRSILFGWEYANPYHVGYYRQIRQRATDMIRAQYSQDMGEVQNFIRMYGVDFLLLDAIAYTPEYLSANPWFRQWKPTAKNVLAQMEQGVTPALSSVMERCTVFNTENLVVIKADCITTPQK